MKSSDSKLALLLGTDLLLLVGDKFYEIVKCNENGARSSTVAVGSKRSSKLFKMPLEMQGADTTANRHAIGFINAILEETGAKCALLLVLLGWTGAKQCLANGRDFGNLKV